MLEEPRPRCAVSDDCTYVNAITEAGNDDLLRHIVGCPSCLHGLAETYIGSLEEHFYFPALFSNAECTVALAPSLAAIAITKTDSSHEASCPALNRLAEGTSRHEAFANLLDNIKEYVVGDLEQHRNKDGEFGGEAAEHVKGMLAEAGDLVVWWGKYSRAMRRHLASL